MKKICMIIIGVLVMSVLGLNLNSVSASEKTSIYIDPELVGTKISIEDISKDPNDIQPMDGGYLYKRISYTEDNKTKTYLGKVTKTKSISWGVSTKNGFITLGGTYSETREYYEYKNTRTITSVWAVYDKYSVNYMYNETLKNNMSYLSYERVK